MKRYHEVEFEKLTGPEFAALPDGYAQAWLKRPRHEPIKTAERFMYFRASLIVALAVYMCWIGSWESFGWINFVLAGYEAAYYINVNKMLTDTYYKDMSEHNDIVAELDRKYFGIERFSSNQD